MYYECMPVVRFEAGDPLDDSNVSHRNGSTLIIQAIHTKATTNPLRFTHVYTMYEMPTVSRLLTASPAHSPSAGTEPADFLIVFPWLE